MASQIPDSGIAPSARDPRMVFVAYGRNLKAKDAMFTFLRALVLNPLDWPQLTQLTGEGSPGIERAVNRGLETAQGYVVLLTPDELVEVRPELISDGTVADRGYQPRPNVLVELGQALATNAERTVIVSLGDVRLPSNIAGRHVLKMNNTSATRHELKLKLETVGLKVVESNQGWLSPATGGDFDGAISSLLPVKHAPQTPGQQEIEKRHNEIAAKAMNKFLAWRAKNGDGDPPNADLLIRWIESGGTSEFLDFDHNILVVLVKMLRDNGYKEASCPSQKEYDEALRRCRARHRGLQGLI